MLQPNEFKIGDKVRVGEKIGKIVKLENKKNATVIKVAFNEGSPKVLQLP